MKISPVMPSVNSAPSQSAPDINRYKMTTMVTPGVIPDGIPVQAQVTELPPSQRNPNDPNPAADENKPLSPQFAALAKQRRALQVKEREILAREKALSGGSAESANIEMARIKADPLGVLQAAGVSYEDLAKAITENPVNPEIYALKNELNSLKQGIDSRFTEREQMAEQQALREMRREAMSLAQNGDEFEMVRETRSIPQVMKLIERTYREQGELLSVQEALGLVENQLLKNTEKLASLKKVQSKFVPPAPPPVPRYQGMRTLTNQHTANVPLTRQQRALMAFSGTLKT